MKKTIAILLAVMMVFGMAACSVSDKTEPTGDTMMEFTVTVVHADGTTKDFTYETNQEFVGPVLQEAGLIKGNAGPYGLEISEVDGEKAVYSEDNAYWALYEGEEYALQGIDTTKVVDGAIYKLVYTGA